MCSLFSRVDLSRRLKTACEWKEGLVGEISRVEALLVQEKGRQRKGRAMALLFLLSSPRGVEPAHSEQGFSPQ